ncbi:MAG TPA: alpha/beta fold hydrolase [Ktedonobacterales bacterium]|nr:alpha/beta fold hydrolase [Ktedonobacterales bacterium]
MPLGEERSVRFPSRDRQPYQLEGMLHFPQVSRFAPPLPAAVLCHPQPASSDMDDLLLLTLARELALNGVLALRFNFRGVGRSQGEQTDGRFEPLDLAGAAAYLLQQPETNPEKLCAIGHAFGAYVALTYAPFDPRMRTVVAISLPLFRVGKGFAEKFERPKLFVTGEFDEVCPSHKLEPFVAALPGPKGMKIVTGARHLMRGYENETSGAVVTYIKRWAAMPGV